MDPSSPLPRIRTQSASRYDDGVRALVAGEPRTAEASFAAAIAADVPCALAHAGLAVALSELGQDGRAADTALVASRLAARTSRHARHHVAIVALVLRGRTSRAAVLGREHLLEFPTDAVVRHVLTRRCDDVDDLSD